MLQYVINLSTEQFKIQKLNDFGPETIDNFTKIDLMLAYSEFHYNFVHLYFLTIDHKVIGGI